MEIKNTLSVWKDKLILRANTIPSSLEVFSGKKNPKFNAFLFTFSAQNLKRIKQAVPDVQFQGDRYPIEKLKKQNEYLKWMEKTSEGLKSGLYDHIDVDYKLPPLGNYQHKGVLLLSNIPSLPLFADCGLGKCLYRNSAITTFNGSITIGELWDLKGTIEKAEEGEVKILDVPVKVPTTSEGKTTWTLTNKIYRELLKKGTPIKKTKASYKETIISSVPHKFLINRDGWVDSCSAGDTIWAPSRIPSRSITHLDNDKVLMFAWILADGTERKTSSNGTSINCKDDHYRSKLKDLIEINGMTWSVPPEKINLSITGVNKLRSYFGWNYKMRYSREKTVPQSIINSSMENKKVFLGFYISKEGSFYKGILECSSASRQIIYSLSDMLLEFGVTSKINMRMGRATNGKSKEKKPYWYLFVMGDQLRKFNSEITLYHDHKQKKLEKFITKTPNPNIDLLPARDLASSLHERLRKKGMSQMDIFGVRTYFSCRKGGVSRKMAFRLIRLFPDEPEVKKIKELLEMDIFFDLVTESSIDELKEDTFIFDLMIPKTHNYLVNGLWSHNTYMVLASTQEQIKQKTISRGKTLICAKLSTLETGWMEDLEQFTDLKATILWEPSAYKKKEKIHKKLESDADIFIINHDGVKVFEKELIAKNFEKVVIDESTVLKSFTSTYKGSKGGKFGKALMNVSHAAKWRVIMTGTPASNGAQNLWGQFHFLDPNGLLLEASFKDFRSRWMEKIYFCKLKKDEYGRPIKGKPVDPMAKSTWVMKKGAAEEISRIITPITYRLKIRDQLKDLPELTPVSRIISMTKAQTKHYKEMEDALATTIDDEYVSVTNRLTELMKLRQITGGFLIDHKEVAHEIKKAPKLEEMDSLIFDEIDEDKKIVIFAQYRYEIETLEKRYKDLGVGSVYGGNSSKKNLKNIKYFINDPDMKIIILHPKSGAHGITFTVAHYMIFYSYDYSAEDNYQAVKRIERAGQKNPMFVYYLICKGSIDEKMYQTIVQKLKNQEKLINQDRINLDLLKDWRMK